LRTSSHVASACAGSSSRGRNGRTAVSSAGPSDFVGMTAAPQVLRILRRRGLRGWIAARRRVRPENASTIAAIYSTCRLWPPELATPEDLRRRRRWCSQGQSLPPPPVVALPGRLRLKKQRDNCLKECVEHYRKESHVPPHDRNPTSWICGRRSKNQSPCVVGFDRDARSGALTAYLIELRGSGLKPAVCGPCSHK